MLQRFIELGEGYSDIYELIEIIERNQDRLQQLLLLHSESLGQSVCSVAVILRPAPEGNFQPIYICREGIPFDSEKENKRVKLFREAAKKAEKNLPIINVKHSTSFNETALYYQYLTGILRTNRLLFPLQ